MIRAMIASGIEPRAIAGRIRCLTASQAAVQLPRDDPVEDVEVRRVVGVEEHVLAADARQPAELDGEHPLEDQGEEEDRDRDADQREEEARVVGGRPWRFAATNPSGIPISVANSIAVESELDGRREPLAELLGDRAPRGDARAEVARPDGLQVAPVLLVERVVEAVLVADLRDRLVGRPLAEQRLRRGAGQRADPDEDEEREPDQDRDEQQQPADGEAEQSAPTSSSAGLPSFDRLSPTRRSGRSRTAPGRPGSACSRRRSTGTPAPASCAAYGTPGRKFMIIRFAC